MVNNKEVKNIVDHQKQNPLEALLSLKSILMSHEDRLAPADNPMQPPKLQQLPAGASVGGEGEEEREASPDQASSEKLEGCCHAHGCLRGGLRCPLMDPCGLCSWAFVILLFTVMICHRCCHNCD